MTLLIRLAFATTRAGAEAAEQALEAADPAPVSLARYEENGAAWHVEALYQHAPERAAVAGALRAALGSVPPFDLAPLPDRDWVAESLKGLAPVRAGRFVVHGAHDRGRLPPGAIGIEIEAGPAFGTGHHATTRGCLEALTLIARGPRPARVLDLGTGTGVLAIAAARTWHVPVIATDIDPAAVAATHANARANRVGPFVRALHADGVRHPRIAASGRYDLLFANILALPLMRLAAPVAPLMSQRNKIVLSGLLDHQAAMLLGTWREHGFTLVRRLEEGGWATLVLGRAGGSGTLPPPSHRNRSPVW